VLPLPSCFLRLWRLRFQIADQTGLLASQLAKCLKAAALEQTFETAAVDKQICRQGMCDWFAAVDSA